MIDSIINLTKEFIAIPSTVGNTDELQKIFSVIQEKLQGIPATHYTLNNFPSAIYILE